MFCIEFFDCCKTRVVSLFFAENVGNGRIYFIVFGKHRRL